MFVQLSNCIIFDFNWSIFFWMPSMSRCTGVDQGDNILSKMPEVVRSEVKAMVQAVYYAGDEQVARLLARKLDRKYRSPFPPVACFWRDFDACIAYMSIPGGIIGTFGRPIS